MLNIQLFQCIISSGTKGIGKEKESETEKKEKQTVWKIGKKSE